MPYAFGLILIGTIIILGSAMILAGLWSKKINTNSKMPIRTSHEELAKEAREWSNGTRKIDSSYKSVPPEKLPTDEEDWYKNKK